MLLQFDTIKKIIINEEPKMIIFAQYPALNLTVLYLER